MENMRLIRYVLEAVVVASLFGCTTRLSREVTVSEPIDYERAIPLDAEALAEGGIGDAYAALGAELRRYIERPIDVTERIDDDQPSYTIAWGANKFLVYGSAIDGSERQSWGRAAFILFKLVNDQMSTSKYRLYALNGGNDLFGVFLTNAEANAARVLLANRKDWPYLPRLRPPWFGQYH